MKRKRKKQQQLHVQVHNKLKRKKSTRASTQQTLDVWPSEDYSPTKINIVLDKIQEVSAIINLSEDDILIWQSSVIWTFFSVISY